MTTTYNLAEMEEIEKRVHFVAEILRDMDRKIGTRYCFRCKAFINSVICPCDQPPQPDEGNMVEAKVPEQESRH